MDPTPKPMTPTVFAIAGYAGAGKDTFAKAIAYHLGENGPELTVKMADELKEAINHALLYVGLPAVAFTEDRAVKGQIRPLLVEFGRYCRSQDKPIFARLCAGILKNMMSGGRRCVFVTDMRYLNEYQVLEAVCQEHGWTFKPIEIQRVGTTAANDEERDSIRELLDNAPVLTRLSFADGDFASMDVAAAALAQPFMRQ